ncbi:hypothetical protein ONS95_009484 [Cadophora gregata]|uniref:uncharacterized protein n=1 Tax=Cadophora gregata TaxID=51156 RepID=UPI0026DCD85F|nr:uncharacterized protein ONS95_009484 [Cadophora gregata]KAK0124535.1 hypothetical protein ONS95_009484 [Cadophora gregata]KAK0129613.1 hypothetical protein ONS96_000177 [Cadophora gregata f. sp. sojae]
MAEPAVASPATAISLEFRDMDEFVAEQEAIDNQIGHQIAKANPPARVNNHGMQDPLVLTVENDAIRDIGVGNWIGKLIEYRQANPVEAADGGIQYTEITLPGRISPRFSCTVKISESDEVFGCSGNYGFGPIVASFSIKKVAKQFAAKRAIDFLIKNKHMPNDGSVKFPKPPSPPQGAKTNTVPAGELAYITQVPLLCRRLGFNTPTYKITSVIPNAPVCDGYADFGNDLRVDGPVGKVTNVFGKKNAKEAIARIVVSFLKDVERQRMGEQATDDSEEGEKKEKADDDDDDKKRKRSSPDVSETSNKAPKIQDICIHDA